MIHLRSRHLGFAARFAAAALIAGCGATPLEPSVDGGDDDASATSDTPVAPPVDTGAPVDTGVPTVDAGEVPVDTGVPTVDVVSPPRDTGGWSLLSSRPLHGRHPLL
ncbi:MAG: hypothetical protein IPN17_34480 [Deltaproteobacteria bacterium]|nr:hypothetical protein [Deltaproteobacteria bacterium]